MAMLVITRGYVLLWFQPYASTFPTASWSLTLASRGATGITALALAGFRWISMEFSRQNWDINEDGRSKQKDDYDFGFCFNLSGVKAAHLAMNDKQFL